jgi:aspartyl-tRNA(Asn)/glutamyl-tRNA(Gln) amidotransferase subunit C
MAITKQDVADVAELARLELTSEEAEALTDQLGSILGYIEKLNELNTDDVPAMSHCSAESGDPECAWRDDEARPGLGQRLATASAPDAEAGYFKVPKVIGG